MRKVISFMHVSLDGFVAGPNGEMNWIKVDEEIFDRAGDQTDRADTALYGRTTYEMMEGYWPTAAEKPNASKHDKHHSQWYNSVDKVVLSRTMNSTVLKNTTIISNDLRTQINRLKEKAGSNIIIFGSPGAVHSLTAEDLIDEYWLFMNPVLIGEGIPMFKDIKQRIDLTLKATHSFSCGVVSLHYERKRKTD